MTDQKHNMHALTQELIDKGKHYYVPNYNPRGMILDHGKGATIWDLDGNDYVDLGSGIAVNSLGHQHPKLLEALHTQMYKLWHTSNIFYTEPTIRLAEALVQSSRFATKAFFCNSGAEANMQPIRASRPLTAKLSLSKARSMGAHSPP